MPSKASMTARSCLGSMSESQDRNSPIAASSFESATPPLPSMQPAYQTFVWSQYVNTKQSFGHEAPPLLLLPSPFFHQLKLLGPVGVARVGRAGHAIPRERFRQCILQRRRLKAQVAPGTVEVIPGGTAWVRSVRAGARRQSGKRDRVEPSAHAHRA